MRVKLTEGIVAILDALGAATFTTDELNRFLDARDVVLALLKSKFKGRDITAYTFGDTILFAFRPQATPTLQDVHDFAEMLRRCLMNGLNGGILFRGAFAIGEFYGEEKTNTVLGPAVADAAAWYNAADWIGVSATPRTSLIIDGLMDTFDCVVDHVLVSYDVPLKDKTKQSTKAINWPKGFAVKGLRPQLEAPTKRAQFLKLLTERRVPKGTEDKYRHAVQFFDHCMRLWDEQRGQK